MAFKYQTIAERLRTAIRGGHLRHGQKLTSIRSQGRLQNASLNTVKKAYETLEAEGLVFSKDKVGFFVNYPESSRSEPVIPSVRAIPRLVKNINLLEEIQGAAAHPGRMPLGTVLLAASLQPVEELRRSLIRAQRGPGGSSNAYGPIGGNHNLREAISSHYRSMGMLAHPDEILITNGCMDALRLAVEVVSQPGDAIAVPTPCFSGQLQLLGSLGRKIVEISSTSEGIDLEQLEAVFEQKTVSTCMLTTCYQNPLGYDLSTEEKQRIVMLAKHFNVTVIEDDVFGECSLATERSLPLKAWDTKGNVIYCSSFSKTVAAGYRIGWCLAGNYQKQVSSLQLATNLSVNTPLQLALADFVHSGGYSRHLRHLNINLTTQMRDLRHSVTENFGSSCRVSNPRGGYSLWVELLSGQDTYDVYRKAQRAGIDIVPGKIFGNNSRLKHCFRLNGGNPWSDKLEASIRTLNRICKAQMATEK